MSSARNTSKVRDAFHRRPAHDGEELRLVWPGRLADALGDVLRD